MIDIVRRRKRRLLLIAVDRRTGGKQQVSNLMVPASFEDIEESDDIRIDIRPRMVDAVADAGLSRQVDDDIRLKRRKNLFYGLFIS